MGLENENLVTKTSGELFGSQVAEFFEKPQWNRFIQVNSTAEGILGIAQNKGFETDDQIMNEDGPECRKLLLGKWFEDGHIGKIYILFGVTDFDNQESVWIAEQEYDDFMDEILDQK